MPEAGNYFAWLGLAPGVYSPQELANRLEEYRRFARDESRLADAAMAFCLLRDPERQAELLRNIADEPLAGAAAVSEEPPEEASADGKIDPHIEQAFTAAVGVLLEGETGLLRYSSRRRLLDLAGRLGIVSFEANLLIERARFRATQQPAWAADKQVDPRAHRHRLVPWLVITGIVLLVDLAMVLLFLL